MGMMAQLHCAVDTEDNTLQAIVPRVNAGTWGCPQLVKD